MSFLHLEKHFEYLFTMSEAIPLIKVGYNNFSNIYFVLYDIRNKTAYSHNDRRSRMQ